MKVGVNRWDEKARLRTSIAAAKQSKNFFEQKLAIGLDLGDRAGTAGYTAKLFSVSKEQHLASLSSQLFEQFYIHRSTRSPSGMPFLLSMSAIAIFHQLPRPDYNCCSVTRMRMPTSLMETADLGQPDEPNEITIQLVVPEEFAGVTMSELQSRGGMVEEMAAQDGIVSIRASLPKSEYGELREAIHAATQGRGRIESSPSQ